MPLPSRSWTVSCRACDLVIGTVEGGRFVHDASCTRPLAIGAGLLRCCQCAGPLAGDPGPVSAMDEDDEERVAPLLRFLPAARGDEDSRQRL